MPTKFKVSFTLDEQDAAYFRRLYRRARQGAGKLDHEKVIRSARTLVARVRRSKKTPRFVIEAIETLEDLTQLVEDTDYRAPENVKRQVIAAIAYFSNPTDLIHDHVPGLGFLDDAIMIKFVEEEFKHELWGYRKFRGPTAPSEQRPWTKIGGERLKERREEYRKRIRAEVAKRKASDAAKIQAARASGRKGRGLLGW